MNELEPVEQVLNDILVEPDAVTYGSSYCFATLPCGAQVYHVTHKQTWTPGDFDAAGCQRIKPSSRKDSIYIICSPHKPDAYGCPWLELTRQFIPADDFHSWIEKLSGWLPEDEPRLVKLHGDETKVGDGDVYAVPGLIPDAGSHPYSYTIPIHAPEQINNPQYCACYRRANRKPFRSLHSILSSLWARYSKSTKQSQCVKDRP